MYASLTLIVCLHPLVRVCLRFQNQLDLVTTKKYVCQRSIVNDDEYASLQNA